LEQKLLTGRIEPVIWQFEKGILSHDPCFTWCSRNRK